MTERIIQNYIWDKKDCFSDLLIDIEFPNLIVKENPWDITPSELIFNKVITQYKDTWSLVKGLHLFGCEVALKKYSESTIRTDFLGIFEGTNHIAIVELKKSAQTERQAFTELLGYASHIQTVFLPMSKSDIAYILISPMEERIVKESVINNIIYERNTIFSLIPSWENDDITTLKLTPWIPSLIEIDNLINAIFSENNFDIWKIVWDGLHGEWSPSEKGDDPNNEMIDRMNTVASYTAQIMETKGINGFVYCSQAYSEHRDLGHLTNAIVIGGLNPYQSTKIRKILTDYPDASIHEASKADINRFKISDIIPEIKNKYFDENDDLSLGDLSLSWSDQIASIAFNVQKDLTTSLSIDKIQHSWGSFNWNTFQLNVLEDIMVHNFKINATGLLRELYIEYSKLDYEYIRKYGTDNHPIYKDGDIPKYMVDILNNQYFFRDFIRRLFNQNHTFDTDIDINT